jgi:hypothetical protein
LFEEDAHARVGIRDQHGCTRWYGPIVVFIVLPQVGSTSLDLLRRAAPDAFVGVVRLVIRDLKKRLTSRELRRAPEDAEWLAFIERVNAAYTRYGRELPSVSRAFQRIVDGSLWCAGFALPELRGASESQVLRSLGLAVDGARSLVAARKIASPARGMNGPVRVRGPSEAGMVAATNLPAKATRALYRYSRR